MNASTQIIPMRFGVEIDEGEEFRRLAERTDARCIRLAEQHAEEQREERRAAKERRAERRRIAHNCKLLMLGMLATCCGICAVLVYGATYPALAVFPAAIGVLSLWKGIRD